MNWLIAVAAAVIITAGYRYAKRLISRTRLGHAIHRWLNPAPPSGYAWCHACCLNQGRTIELIILDMKAHVGLHDAADWVHLTGFQKEDQPR